MNYHVFLQSGGTRVPVHVGAVQALHEAGIEVSAWAGISAGSLVASVFACGFTQQQAFELMLNTDYRQFLDASPVSLIRRFGLNSGHRFEQWLDAVLGKRRFRDLQMPLAVVATDVSTGSPLVFSNENTPDVKVATAVRCSISLPGIFAIPRVDGRFVFDGCFTSVHPDILFPADRNIPCALVRIEDVHSGTLESAAASRRRENLTMVRYLFRVAELVLTNLKGAARPDQFDLDLCIRLQQTSGLKFGLSHDEKHELYLAAYIQSLTSLHRLSLRDSIWDDAPLTASNIPSADTVCGPCTETLSSAKLAAAY